MSVEGTLAGEIGEGLVVFVCAMQGDENPLSRQDRFAESHFTRPGFSIG